MLPSPAELKYFLEVANTSNLSRASERLGISQPSLSLAIKRLEETIGTELLIRHQQGVTLTQAGKQLLRHTRQLLQDWEHTKSQALASHQEVQGIFVLGCHSALALYVVSGFLPALVKKHAKLEIQLKHDLSRKILEQVVNLSIDVAIVVNPIKHPDLIIRKLCDDEVGFWVGPGKHPIQKLDSGEAVLMCDPELAQTQALLKAAKKKQLSYGRVMDMDCLEVIANLTASGCGVGILPERVALAMYPTKLKHIPNTPIYKDELCLIYRHENRHIHAIQVIVDAIKAYFEI